MLQGLLRIELFMMDQVSFIMKKSTRKRGKGGCYKDKA